MIDSSKTDSRIDAKIWMIRNQKGRRNLSTFVMVELGLKLEDRIKQKGLENKVTCSFDKSVDKEKTLLQNSAKPSAVNSPVETRKEIANFTNPSHDTVMKVKKIKEKAPCGIIQQVRSGDISINQAYTTIKKQEKNLFRTIEAHSTIHGLFSGSWLDFHRLNGFVFHVLLERLEWA